MSDRELGMTLASDQDVASLLSVLGQEHRIAIFRLLCDKPSGLYAGQICRTLNMLPPNCSFHLDALNAAGAISRRREGRHIRYTVSALNITKVVAVTDAMAGRLTKTSSGPIIEDVVTGANNRSGEVSHKSSIHSTSLFETASKETPMPRKPVYETGPMTPAERMCEKRARDRSVVWGSDTIDPSILSDSGLLEQFTAAFSRRSQDAIPILLKEIDKRLGRHSELPLINHERKTTMSSAANIPELGRFFAQSHNEHDVHLVNMTPESAGFLVSNYLYKEQRKLVKAHVDDFLCVKADGGFRSYSSIEFCVLPDGDIVLVDGQHRLTAISKQSDKIPVCIHFQKATDMDEVRARYDQHDVINRLRKSRDLMGDIPQELRIGSQEAERLLASVKAIHANFGDLSDDTQKRMEVHDGEFLRSAMRAWAPEAHTFLDIYRASKSADRKLFYNAPVMGVALVTLRHPPAARAADEFWMRAMFDDGLRQGDPAKALLNWFHNKERDKVRPSPTDKARACAVAWHAYYSGRDLQKIGTLNTKSAVSIMGSEVRIPPSRKQ